MADQQIRFERAEVKGEVGDDCFGDCFMGKGLVNSKGLHA